MIPFKLRAHLGIFSVLNIRVGGNKFPMIRPIQKFNNYSMLHDAFFESQDFKHSLTFE